MTKLNQLSDTHRFSRNRRRVGRGPGSKRGKTCGRGSKGDKARSGYKRHFGHEGGQLPLYRKLPCRGFANGRFRNEVFSINLSTLENLFEEGDLISLETLKQKGVIPLNGAKTLKILGQGELRKKVKIQAHAFSEGAKVKLEQAALSYKVVE
jgi:large subunit ribosomal protein L15